MFTKFYKILYSAFIIQLLYTFKCFIILFAIFINHNPRKKWWVSLRMTRNICRCLLRRKVCPPCHSGGSGAWHHGLRAIWSLWSDLQARQLRLWWLFLSDRPQIFVFFSLSSNTWALIYPSLSLSGDWVVALFEFSPGLHWCGIMADACSLL